MLFRRKASTGFGGDYQVIKCGASGHNVRSRPSLKAPPVGMLVLGNRIGVSEYIVNADGCWVLLDEPTKDRYCFNTDGEAWSLAMGHNNILYLGTVGDREAHLQIPNSIEDLPKASSSKRGFNFGQNLPEPHFSFGSHGSFNQAQPNNSADLSAGNPFVFGDTSKSESPKHARKDGTRDAKLTGFSKWFKKDDGNRSVIQDDDVFFYFKFTVLYAFIEKNCQSNLLCSLCLFEQLAIKNLDTLTRKRNNL